MPLDPESLSTTVGAFLNLVEKWGDVIRSFHAEEAETPAPRTEDPPAFGFMQV